MTLDRPWLVASITVAGVLVGAGGLWLGLRLDRSGAHTHDASPGLVATSTPTATIPAALRRESRPIGRGARFHPVATGPVLGRCDPLLGRRIEAHLEVFAANRVALVAAGIGTRPPRRETDGTVRSARCYGSLVTLDPTGVVRIRAGAKLTVADVFASWGQPLSAQRLLSFHGKVTAYVNGRRWLRTSPMAIPITRHAEIVLEVGPFVLPHPRYRFAPGG